MAQNGQDAKRQVWQAGHAAGTMDQHVLPECVHVFCSTHGGQAASRRTSRVDDEAAFAAPHLEAATLDAHARDLALLQQLLEPREVLDAPRELALEHLCTLCTRALAQQSLLEALALAMR